MTPPAQQEYVITEDELAEWEAGGMCWSEEKDLHAAIRSRPHTSTPDNLVWMTPEEEEKRIRTEERIATLEKMVKILAAHTIYSDDFLKDRIKSGWILVGGYERIVEEIESLRSEP